MDDLLLPTRDEFRAAAARIAGALPPTPLVALHGADEVLLKLEIHQPIGSFKVRGILHAVERLDSERRSRGLSTVSAGNTAKALAWAAARFGVEARILMPENAPRTKVEAVRALGGLPVLVPTAEVFRFLRERGWEREPYAFLHPWTNRDVRLGHGSIALELLEQCPDLETVFVPVGGGGLLGGVGAALKRFEPSTRIVAVEPAGCPALHASVAAGRAVSVPCETLCDGVAVPYITDEMFPLLAGLADDVVLIEEDEVRRTIRRLALENHVVVEGAGALAAAAALGTPRRERGRSVALVTGGCIDGEDLRAILGD